MEYRTALLVGRFQPFHLGHLYLVKKALSLAGRLVIGVGSTNIRDDDNPLDWTARRSMLEMVLEKEGLRDRVDRIVPLADYFNDQKWLDNVLARAGTFDAVIGNNPWTNRILGKAGFKVIEVPFFKRYRYEGREIRKLFRAGKTWQDRVPEYLQDLMADNLA